MVQSIKFKPSPATLTMRTQTQLRDHCIVDSGTVPESRRIETKMLGCFKCLASCTEVPLIAAELQLFTFVRLVWNDSDKLPC